MAERIVPLPSPEMMRKYFSYDPNNGSIVFNRVDSEIPQWNAQRAGKAAFNADDGNGYLRGGFMGSSLRAHRVAWVLYYGDWPSDEVDHINADRKDNRISNLRASSRLENGKNRRKSKANTSGYKGVSFYKRYGKWEACIKTGSITTHLGLYNNPEDAHKAYCKAALEQHGEFARFK